MTAPAPSLCFEVVTGKALLAQLPRLAELRIAVFREWPYLYAGDPAYEERYLAHYAESPGAMAVIARAGAAIVGCSTCQPMSEAAAVIREAFAEYGLDPTRWCYFGESVLLAAFRGSGAGRVFFALREAHARRLGLAAAAFCAVQRDPADPRRPPDYRPLDAFWRRCGYQPRPDLAVSLAWREVGQEDETPHRLGFWVKARL